MKISNKIIYLSVAAALASWSATGAAGGFAIGTQSGSGTGNAFAGGAAVADDASVAWYNPAAMTALPTGSHLTTALHVLIPSFKFNNTGSTGAFAGAGTGNGGDGGDWAVVPNGFFVTSFTPALRFGLALNAPFGLKTEYDPGWRGRATGVESAIRSINVNASLAYKVNNNFSIGGGINVQRLDAKLSNSFTGHAVPPPNPGFITLKADDIGFGFNLGATFQPTTATRIGAHYRSAIRYKLKGTATSNTIPTLFNGNVTADVKTPDSVSLSVLHQVNPSLELMGDVTWTKWSNIQQLVVTRTSTAAAGAAGSTLNTLQFQWDDTWRFGIGANYRVSPRTKLRFGLAFDQTPTNDLHRTPRLPDQDRTWVAFGVQIKPNPQTALEIGYAHEFVKNASVNVPFAGSTCAAGCLTGNFKNKADIFSVQFTQSF